MERRLLLQLSLEFVVVPPNGASERAPDEDLLRFRHGGLLSHRPANGRAFSGEPSERSERPERERGRRVRCNAMLGRSSTHLRLTAIAIVGPGIACAWCGSDCPVGRKYHTPGAIRPSPGSCFIRAGSRPAASRPEASNS